MEQNKANERNIHCSYDLVVTKTQFHIIIKFINQLHYARFQPKPQNGTQEEKLLLI